MCIRDRIFYLEKLDINEEKVRLRQHCKYFMDTIDGEEYPGRKLGFIIQEMGREINQFNALRRGLGEDAIQSAELYSNENDSISMEGM